MRTLRFRQTTKGTIGQGDLAIGDPAASAPPGALHLDLTQAQVVTANSKSGFTLYADKGAINGASALASGNKDSSIILQGLGTLTSDPLSPTRALANEVKSLSDHVAASGVLERLVSGTQRLFEGDAKVSFAQTTKAA